MEMVNLVEARRGRILGRPVTNSSGAVLCPAGLPLTDALVEKLLNAGIESVYVQGGGRQGLSIEQRIVNLKARFRDVTDSGLRELGAIAEARLEAMAQQQADLNLEQQP